MTVIWKSEQPAAICKLDEARQLAFGWANVAVRVDGELITDSQDDSIEPEELEIAAYDFVLTSRELDLDHTATVRGHLVESLVVTPDKLRAMGLAKTALPLGWWVGFYVEDPGTWARVKSGELAMFSIGGESERVPA